MRKFFHRVKTGAIANRRELIALGLLFGLDQVTKLAAKYFLTQGPVQVLPFFQLQYVENTGSAFGMLQGANHALIVVMVAVIGYMLYSWKELCAQGRLVKWGCVCILAGALGNLYDRIALGYVIDFLDFLVWPVFNVADSAITIGGGLFVLSLLGHSVKKQEEK